MYFYKMLIFLFFCCGLQVHSQFSPLEVTGSGDGLNENSTYSRLPLLDDNGEISTVVMGDLIKNIEEAEGNFTDTKLFPTDTTAEQTTIKFSGNDAFTDITIEQNSQTVHLSTDSQTTDQETTDTLVDTTTISLYIMSSTTETTTFADTTTEEAITSTETTTTSTTVKATKKPIKTDSATEIAGAEYKTKPRDTVTKIPSTSAPVSTVAIPEDAGKRCLFENTGLKCDVELICYGDGEIDCTDDEEMGTDEEDFSDAILSSVDESDLISEGETSETLPIRRINSNSDKIDLFKMFPLIPTSNDESMEKNEQSTTTSMPSFNLTMPSNEELIAEKNGEMNDTMNIDDSDHILDSEVTEELGRLSTEFTDTPKLYDEEKLPAINDNSSFTDVIDDLEGMIFGKDEIFITNSPNASEIEIPPKVNETIANQKDISNGTSIEDISTAMKLTTSNTLVENVPGNVTEKDDQDHLVISRTKRDKNANSSNGYYISNYKVSELESSKKTLKVKFCKLNGNIVCIPRPTKSSCSGKTLCQVPPQAIETVEKPATQKGLEKWTIAVIVVCAITATFTIALLTYLVFTSYKKLKVQPQNGVTTLNYFNSAQP